MSSIPSIAKIYGAQQHMKDCPLIIQTRLDLSRKLSDKYGANIYLKREDMQLCRSYKIRGAAHAYKKLSEQDKKKGIVIASDGNYSSACAYVANDMKIKTIIFLPKVIPSQRMQQILDFGQSYVEIHQEGDNFEEAWEKAVKYSKEHGLKALHPFDNTYSVEANGVISLEILKDISGDLDFVFVPIGGGALAAGISTVMTQLSPETQIIGVEPENANSMQLSIAKGSVVTVKNHSRFCDGSAISKVSEQNFKTCKQLIKGVNVVSEGEVATSILQLYDNGLIVEPSGALSVAALEQNKQLIKGKNVVCVISGGNTDLSRLDTFREIGLMHEGLKYFFLINFPLRQGILRDFVKQCLQPSDEISHIQFNKKNDRERAPALLAIEVKQKQDVELIKQKMKDMKLDYQIVNENKELYDLLI